MKQFFFLLATACLLFSCAEKSVEIPGATPPASGGSGGTTTPTAPVALGKVTFSVDGVAQDYSLSALANNTTVPGSGLHVLAITGIKDAAAKNQIVIGVQSDAEIKAGTYNDTTSLTNYALLGIRDPAGQYQSNNIADGPTVVTISAISSTAVQGSFKGKLQLINTDGTFGKIINVTNGSFNVKVQ